MFGNGRKKNEGDELREQLKANLDKLTDEDWQHVTEQTQAKQKVKP